MNKNKCLESSDTSEEKASRPESEPKELQVTGQPK
jgi:hypothetical protein